jgi:2-polyprenyl-6-methoxyphenol hydroxylase-like FAD-dependent oxidoreductase
MDTTSSLPHVTYVFDEYITSIVETPNSKVEVSFANRLPTAQYDVVVGADGMMSRTRRLAFGRGPNDDEYIHRLGQYAVLFTMPRTEDDSKFAQWYNATRGRLLLLRPDSYGNTRAYAAVTDSDLSRFDGIDKAMRNGNRQEQEDWFEEEFKEAGFQAERCMREMKTADDFYLQQIAQVKMDSWVKGRVVLVGDAAHCPSPISGVVSVFDYRLWIHADGVEQGAASAIVGAYVLAGELSRSPTDIPHALQQYEKTLRPYVDKAQRLVPGAPQIANPQTEWGIWTLNKVTGIASSAVMKGVGGIVGRFLPAFGGTGWPLPDYEASIA